jgi:hypothetical protein
MVRYAAALVFVVFAMIVGFLAFNRYIHDTKQGGVEDYKAVTVVIDGDPVVLGTEGTQYFGTDAKGDINDDGTPDLAFLFTRETGGSGTFYYAVAALQNSEGRYQGTNAVFLGDRIAPQSGEVRNGIVVVNYADRGKDEPFSVAPSVGVTAYLYYQDGELRIERPVQLFYYNPDLDKDGSGNILCSEKGLVAVSRLMPGVSADDAVRTLIEGNLTDGEESRGITTEFPLEGVSLVGSALSGGVLTLTFADPLNKTSGGACRVGILRAQIEATAKQFAGVDEVQFSPEEVFQP